MFLKDVKTEQNVLYRDGLSVVPICAVAQFESDPSVLRIHGDALCETPVLARGLVDCGFEEPIVDECPGTDKIVSSGNSPLLKNVVEIIKGSHVRQT